MVIKRLLIALSTLFCFAALAQEELKPLGGNSVLMQAWKNQKASAQKSQSVTAAFLPFADDFSYFGPYPDPARWVNSTSVFVNHTKATEPITIGVATFDGMMPNGFPYNPAATTGNYPSDTLTSIPLRLDSLNGLNIISSDSVTLRFYYQARGMFERPDNGDDLILDFYNPTTSTWSLGVWSHSGYNPGTDNSFHRVMLPILDTAYLKNGFQFRFRNMSTACGDVDHWHIDAIYIDKKLNPAHDTIVPEISFAFDLRSILKNYTQMPFKQFTGAVDMKTDIDALNNLRNNYSTGVNITTYYQINDANGVNVVQNTNGTNNVPPFGTSGYCSNASLVDPSLSSFTYNGGIPFLDSTSYLLKFYATYVSDNYHANDTIYFRQKFHNYFSYDDGSAEAGYGIGLNGGSAPAVGAFTAVRYKLNVADTLRAIDIYFDPIYGTNLIMNDQIRFYVWDDNGGLPSATLRIDSTAYPYPVFSKTGFDVFQRYQLSAPVTFTAPITFYIGVWQQLNIPIYIGYDLNTDHHTDVLFRTPNDVSNNGWNVSAFAGSLMMHPVFGDSSRAVSVEDHTAGAQHEKVWVYPNPAKDEIFVSSKNTITNIVLCDLLGNVLLEEKTPHVNISSIPNGMYLLKTFTTKGFADTQKLIIAR